jgi:glutamine synthetase
MEPKAKQLRLMYPDILGLERGKYLLGDWTGRTAFCIGVYPLTLDREILPIPGLQFDIGLPDIEVHLDVDSMRPGWEPDTVVGVGDAESGGEPCPVDPRFALRRAIEPWVERGLTPQIAYEFEFYLMEPDGEGGWRPVPMPSHRVYGTGPAIDPDGVADEMVRTATACEFDVESWGSEYDISQFEVNIKYRDALAAADDAFLVRLLIKEIATRRGNLATFIGRPIADRGGSGLHVNLSFRTEDGSNRFEDPSAADGLSLLARQCLAGILAHHEGMAAILAPHTNAYKRLQPDMLNGYWANWGYDDRTVGVRVPPGRGATTRLEQRTADGAANPYLAAAAILHAARLGVENELEPPPPQQPGAEVNTDVKVPPTLEKALELFQADKELCEALGSELVTAFTMLKQAEWDRYMKATPDPETTDLVDWELQYYMPFF